MVTVLRLTLRQLATRSRLLVLAVLALLPMGFAMMIVWDTSATTVADFETILLSGMLSGTIAPLMVLSVAAVAFGNEIEDRTLANLVLTPLPRWKIVVPKVAGVIAAAAPFVLGSALLVSLIGFNRDPTAMLAVTVAAVAVLVLYACLFTWLGLAIRQAMGVGLLYIVLWEGLFSGYVSGIRYLSVRYYGLAVMHGIDPRRFAEDPHVSLGTALLVMGVTSALLVWRSTARLSAMDVP